MTPLFNKKFLNLGFFGFWSFIAIFLFIKGGYNQFLFFIPENSGVHGILAFFSTIFVTSSFIELNNKRTRRSAVEITSRNRTALIEFKNQYFFTTFKCALLKHNVKCERCELCGTIEMEGKKLIQILHESSEFDRAYTSHALDDCATTLKKELIEFPPYNYRNSPLEQFEQLEEWTDKNQHRILDDDYHYAEGACSKYDEVLLFHNSSCDCFGEKKKPAKFKDMKPPETSEKTKTQSAYNLSKSMRKSAPPLKTSEPAKEELENEQSNALQPDPNQCREKEKEKMLNKTKKMTDEQMQKLRQSVRNLVRARMGLAQARKRLIETMLKDEPESEEKNNRRAILEKRLQADYNKRKSGLEQDKLTRKPSEPELKNEKSETSQTDSIREKPEQRNG
ncbi:MAG: hypothetical protein A3G33_02700 [Omnitrophica bacterium RIFCSPLOWO2_12_FULL_44_17]|uniref:Uncharacterized protein n=1 Tax=Candidatus Danuiimicrobium aquiferis TaxID=1801832 RepID=A0A1G1KRI0_9BACT|nr:MAG: hypothetical protein A3G33_02700 [Omnitrophica bacterium RIFCSPLOWO2_12_FULL_44_17]OGX01610.1 MAG: hypothetical protein A3J12_05795 [Omnitrophica bacterium RIFCSPLOWO2_02_FULL_44_11]